MSYAVRVSSLRDDERLALRDLVSWLRERFGTRLKEAALFGSRARGEGDEDSDLDVLVVVDDLESHEGRAVAHHAGDLLTRYDVIVSPFVLSTARMQLLRDRERLIATEIERDRVPL
jgi:predicted nucleotidyltransferase